MGERTQTAVRFSWKAWRDASQSLRWELRRILPSIGLPATAQTQMHKRVNQMLPGWQEFWVALGLDQNLVFGRSAHSLQQEARRAGGVAPQGQEREYWVSTAGLLSILMHGSMHRRSAADKQLVADVLEKLIETTACREALGPFFALQPDDASLQECKMAGLAGCCLCVQTLMDEEVGEQTVKQACSLLLMMGGRHDCPAIMRWCGSKVQELSRVMEANSEQWQGGDVMQLERLAISTRQLPQGGCTRASERGCEQPRQALDQPHKATALRSDGPLLMWPSCSVIAWQSSISACRQRGYLKVQLSHVGMEAG